MLEDLCFTVSNSLTIITKNIRSFTKYEIRSQIRENFLTHENVTKLEWKFYKIEIL